MCSFYCYDEDILDVLSDCGQVSIAVDISASGRSHREQLARAPRPLDLVNVTLRPYVHLVLPKY